MMTHTLNLLEEYGSMDMELMEKDAEESVTLPFERHGENFLSCITQPSQSQFVSHKMIRKWNYKSNMNQVTELNYGAIGDYGQIHNQFLA